jgi:hypothetical protein
VATLQANSGDAGDGFGAAVAISGDGSTIAAGAGGEDSAGLPADNTLDDSGAAYVFRSGAAGFSQARYLKASNAGAIDLFGGSVSLSTDGATLGVGAVAEASNATGADGNPNDDTATWAGAAYVF